MCVVLDAVPEGSWFFDDDCHWMRDSGGEALRIWERARVIECQWVNCIVTIVTMKNMITLGIIQTKANYLVGFMEEKNIGLCCSFCSYKCQKFLTVCMMRSNSPLGLPVMAEREGKGWWVLNPDFRPCVGDSDYRYLLGVCFGFLRWVPVEWDLYMSCFAIPTKQLISLFRRESGGGGRAPLNE